MSIIPSVLKLILEGWSSFVLDQNCVGTTIYDSRETEVNDESTSTKSQNTETNQPNSQKAPHYKKQNFPISELCISTKKPSSRTSLNGTSSSLDNIIVYVELVTALHKCSKLRKEKKKTKLRKQKQMKKQYQGLKGAGENKNYSQCNPSSFVRFKEFPPISLLISCWGRPTFWHEA